MKKRIQSAASGLAAAVAVLSLAGLLTGCGEKHAEVVDRYKPQYDEMRTEMAAIVPLIPGKVTATIPPPKLDPVPEFKNKKLKSNTAIVMFDQLANPDIDLSKEKKLDCYFSNNLIKHLKWTGPDDPMSDNLKKKGAKKGLESELQYPLDLRYLGVVRVFKHDRSKAVSAEKFNGGGMVLGVFLYDRQTKSIVAQGLTVARPDEKVSYKYTDSKNPVQALEDWANSSMAVNAWEAVLASFAEVTGGSFE